MHRAYHKAYALVLFTEQQVTEQSVQLPKEFLVAYSAVTITTNMCFLVTTPCNVYTPRKDDQEPKSLNECRDKLPYKNKLGALHYQNRLNSQSILSL